MGTFMSCCSIFLRNDVLSLPDMNDKNLAQFTKYATIITELEEEDGNTLPTIIGYDIGAGTHTHHGTHSAVNTQRKLQTVDQSTNEWKIRTPLLYRQAI